MDLIADASPEWSTLEFGEPGAFFFKEIPGDDRHAQGSDGSLSNPPAMPVAQRTGLAKFAPYPDIGDLLIEERVDIAGGSLSHDPTDRAAMLPKRLQQRKVDGGFFDGRFT